MSSIEDCYVPRIVEKIQTSVLNGFKLGVMNGNPGEFKEIALLL
jgi:hypothetical protein